MSTGPAKRSFDTVQEMVLIAHGQLDPAVWEYATFGAETETTVRRNRFALDALAIKPRIARDMSRIDPRASLFGRVLRIPALLAPMGSITRFDAAGLSATARAAMAFGTIAFIASHATDGAPMPEDIRGLPTIYAIHPDGDDASFDAEIDKATHHDCLAVSIATQSAFYSRRERDIHNGLHGKGQEIGVYAARVTPPRASSPGETVTPPLAEGSHAEMFEASLSKARLSWDLVRRVRRRCELPVIVKGIQTAQDAAIAVEHGVDVIYVSNNGGRALDHVRASMEALPEIAGAVGGRAQIIVDGGFVRGTDIIKAIALGADAVCLGRLQAWALAANGEAGVVRMLEILEEEIVIAMGLMGARSLADIVPDCVTRVEPCTPPHPLSAFPIVMERLAQG